MTTKRRDIDAPTGTADDKLLGTAADWRKALKPQEKNIFVFGSNLAGRHGAGSALETRRNWGAEYGIGEGPTGRAYAIPTKDESLNTLPLTLIRMYVDRFIVYARWKKELKFEVVKIGCGLAGYKEHQIAPMFADAPKNVTLPEGWRK